MRGQVLLLESGRPTEVDLRSRLVSLLLHSGLIVVVVIATAQQTMTSLSKPEEHRIDYKVTLPPPVEMPRSTQTLPASIEIPKGHQILIAPVSIPDQLPTIDVTKAITDAGDYTGTGVAGGRGGGKEVVATNTATTIEPGKVFGEREVSEQAVALSGGGSPRYPDILRSAGVEGQSFLEFTVDTTGRVLMNSVVVLSESHSLFTQAAKNALPQMRFVPAKIGERKVPQRVTLPFTFTITREENSHRSPIASGFFIQVTFL